MRNKLSPFINLSQTSTLVLRAGLIALISGCSACSSVTTQNSSVSQVPANPSLTTQPVFHEASSANPVAADSNSNSDDMVANMIGLGARKPNATGSTRACGAQPSQGDTSAQIQSCLDNTQDGDTMELAPGVYGVGRMLHIDHAITLTTATGSGPCRDNANGSCAELRAMPTVAAMDRGFLKVSAAHVTLARVVVNGNKMARQNSPEAAQCRNGNNGQGINIHVDGTQFSFLQSSSINALCGSGLEVGGVSEGLRINQSFVAFNGIHNLQSLWSDGITVSDSVNAEILGNEISDNTDVDLIFGGCKACQIRDNQITHSNSFTQSSFAAMMMQAWPNATSGNYNDSAILNNRIDCGSYRCGFGLLIGSNSWYVAPAFGGTYRGNHISGAQSGFVINDATGAVEIGSNIVDNSGGTFLTSGGMMKMAAYALSPKSAPFMVYADDSRSYRWQSQEGTGKIANWWTKDSSGVPSNDRDSSATPAGGIPTCSQMGAPSTDSQFVLRLYCQILGRDPDVTGYPNWLKQAQTTHDRAGLVSAMFFSPESVAHNQIQLRNAQAFVRAMYKTILMRDVDDSGLTTWTNRFNSSPNAQSVFTLFMQNAEPKQTFGI